MVGEIRERGANNQIRAFSGYFFPYSVFRFLCVANLRPLRLSYVRGGKKSTITRILTRLSV